jgi:neutral/alkaline ceramidase-like enzyme
MTARIDTPQSRCRIGFARADITPPVGIYHRMWGAASHDRATGVHSPLLATALWMESIDGPARQLVVGLDHCVMDGAEFARIREAIHLAAGLPVDDICISLSHTHGSAWMSRSRSHLPGGDLIGPYLDTLAETSSELAKRARGAAKPATMLYGTARCSLAAHRDMWDEQSKQSVCGFNPSGPADDTVVVARAVADDGDSLGTIVNYACHPTTLAWQNSLLSPDYVGRMRTVLEGSIGWPCLFLQGASGDLGPRDGYVGETIVADRNGRQLGYAALSGLEALPTPGTAFEYAGPVVSGAILGTWRRRPLDAAELTATTHWDTKLFVVNLPYRSDLPKADATRTELAHWEAEEGTARAAGDAARAAECRARAEQMTRQLARLASLPAEDSYPFPVRIARIGGAAWVFTPGELYQHFQIRLRAEFPNLAVIVATLTNDWQPGYLPTKESYGRGIYQEVIAAVAPGSLEALTEEVCRRIGELL